MIGTGIYTPAEAAALIKAPAAEIRRWAFGYVRRRGGDQVQYDSLIQTDLPEIDGKQAVTFLELVELMYIKGFRRAGAPWKVIHEAASVAARMYETSHPFAMRQFFADPGGIYTLLEEEHGGESPVRLIGHGQHAFDEIVRPYLGQLEFDPLDVPTRWWPLGKEGRVVVDPAVSFGAPIVAEAGVPTHVLAEAVEAEREYDRDRAIERVAWLYKVPHRHIQTAVRFEEWLNAA
jgi:uncharacterized protein (DUF433 family)